MNSFINSKLSKSNIIIKLKEHIIKERNYINNEYNIIKIQSFVRMFLKKYRYMCANETDVLTMNCKMEIENPYFYVMWILKWEVEKERKVAPLL